MAPESSLKSVKTFEPDILDLFIKTSETILHSHSTGKRYSTVLIRHINHIEVFGCNVIKCGMWKSSKIINISSRHSNSLIALNKNSPQF